MTDQRQVRVRCISTSKANANKSASELRCHLLRVAGAGATIEIVRDDEETMDFGSTLVLVLGTGAAIAVAEGIRDFIAKWGDSIVIETAGGKVIARGDSASGIDAAAVAAALQRAGP
ncbi:MAG: hypothetical protein R3D05_12265 [Dongiaceae bacterium]